MTKTVEAFPSLVLAGAMAAALTLALPSATAGAADMEKMMKDTMKGIDAHKLEKCFGVARAGQNDCKTATTSCAGSATKDGDKSAFIVVANGTCGKIVGSSDKSA